MRAVEPFALYDHIEKKVQVKLKNKEPPFLPVIIVPIVLFLILQSDLNVIVGGAGVLWI